MKILKISTLEKGWADRDHLMLHANFHILVDFVERERSFEIIDWNYNAFNLSESVQAYKMRRDAGRDHEQYHFHIY